VCFFSKHLPGLAWAPLADAVKAMGFDGVDLTARPGGHVDPARAAADLPRAIEAIRSRGVAVPMITTALTSASDPTARPILATAAAAGVRFAKLGYWRYALKDVRREIAATGRDLAGLAALARELGIRLGFHNHAGYIGASLWDVVPEIDPLPAEALGYYFDPRHAVIDGGQIVWKSAFLRAAPRLAMVAVKDAVWEKDARGWRPRECPLGEGMVDWTWFAGALAAARFAGPISLHLEYELRGDSPAAQQEAVLQAGARDLKALRRFLEGAYA
jgi:sugar phosphate isomerase/epimerase